VIYLTFETEGREKNFYIVARREHTIIKKKKTYPLTVKYLGQYWIPNTPGLIYHKKSRSSGWHQDDEVK
jgi:hypothetical protein